MNDKFNLHAECAALHAKYPAGLRRPIIGITANFSDERLATLAELADDLAARLTEISGGRVIVKTEGERFDYL